MTATRQVTKYVLKCWKELSILTPPPLKKVVWYGSLFDIFDNENGHKSILLSEDGPKYDLYSETVFNWEKYAFRDFSLMARDRMYSVFTHLNGLRFFLPYLNTQTHKHTFWKIDQIVFGMHKYSKYTLFQLNYPSQIIKFRQNVTNTFLVVRKHLSNIRKV